MTTDTRAFTPLATAGGVFIVLRYTHIVPHFFYLARCADGSLYAGTCIDVAQRQEMHNSGKGAKYTRSRGPVEIIYTETFETLSEARKREAAVKKLKKIQKEELVTAPLGKKSRRKKV